MFTRQSHGCRALGLLSSAVYLIGVRAVEPAWAQTSTANASLRQNADLVLTDSDVQERLQKPIHLMLGAVTVPQLTAALSAQCGLRVEAADYLRERRLVVQLDNVSAAAALNALGELNDWAWRDKGGGQIVIARKLPLLRQEPETVPLRARAALPKDIRAFCRIGSVYDHAPPPESKGVDGYDNSVPALYRPNLLANILRQKLVDSLKPGILGGGEVAWSRMTPPQRQDMLGVILFETLYKTVNGLYGEPLPFLADPTRAFLEMHGNTFTIMTRSSLGRRSGFGTEIKPRTEEQ